MSSSSIAATTMHPSPLHPPSTTEIKNSLSTAFLNDETVPDQQHITKRTQIISPAWTNVLGGFCAGAIARTTMAPIERIKLVLQLSSVGISKAPSGNAFEVAMGVLRQDGLLAFWRGNMSNVIQQGGTAGLNFMFMDRYKAAISPVANNQMLASFLSGGLAGGTATTLLYPFQFARTRLAMDFGGPERIYPGGMKDVFRSILEKDGLRGVYQGYGVALGGVVIYRSLHLGGYDALKTVMNDRSGGKKLTLGDRFFAAQIVSLIAGTVCYPIDSVRRRLMMQAGQTERLYKNTADCVLQVLRTEGMKGFYLGIGPNVIRSFGSALVLVAFDTFKGMIH